LDLGLKLWSYALVLRLGGFLCAGLGESDECKKKSYSIFTETGCESHRDCTEPNFWTFRSSLYRWSGVTFAGLPLLARPRECYWLWRPRLC